MLQIPRTLGVPMANEFKAKAAKRANPSRKPRDQASGQFEEPSPLTDPGLRRHVLRVIECCDALSPVMLAMTCNEGDSGRFMEQGLAALLLLRAVHERALFPSETQEGFDPNEVIALMKRNYADVFARAASRSNKALKGPAK